MLLGEACSARPFDNPEVIHRDRALELVLRAAAEWLGGADAAATFETPDARARSPTQEHAEMVARHAAQDRELNRPPRRLA
jgi:hypothetical protein